MVSESCVAVTDDDVGRHLQDLYEAADLTQLRQRLVRHVAELGFWGVGEYVNCLQVTRTYASPRKFIWDNLSDHVGSRRLDLIDAVFSAALSQGIAEENRRLRWLASQKRPYLLFSSETAQFKFYREFRKTLDDFRLRSPNTLVVPVPDGGAGLRRLWAFCETSGSLRNAHEAACLMMAYNHLRQLLSTRGTDVGSRQTTSGNGATDWLGRDPMHASAVPSEPSKLLLAQGCPTRKQAVRAYIEDHLNDPELGVDRLCRALAMSRRTVYRMFADDGGVTSYLTERRLARAFSELSAASPSRGLICAVAERHGFVDQNHFSRLFRKRFQIAPSDAIGLRSASPEPMTHDGSSKSDLARGVLRSDRAVAIR